MKIAVLGLGKMGQAISERLLADGHRLPLWNCSNAKADRLLDMGATEADTPRGGSHDGRGRHHQPRQ